MTQTELQIAYKEKIELIPEFCWTPKKSLSGKTYWLEHIKREIRPVYLEFAGHVSKQPHEYRIVYVDKGEK